MPPGESIRWRPLARQGCASRPSPPSAPVTGRNALRHPVTWNPVSYSLGQSPTPVARWNADGRLPRGTPCDGKRHARCGRGELETERNRHRANPLPYRSCGGQRQLNDGCPRALMPSRSVPGGVVGPVAGGARVARGLAPERRTATPCRAARGPLCLQRAPASRLVLRPGRNEWQMSRFVSQVGHLLTPHYTQGPRGHHIPSRRSRRGRDQRAGSVSAGARVRRRGCWSPTGGRPRLPADRAGGACAYR